MKQLHVKSEVVGGQLGGEETGMRQKQTNKQTKSYILSANIDAGIDGPSVFPAWKQRKQISGTMQQRKQQMRVKTDPLSLCLVVT